MVFNIIILVLFTHRLAVIINQEKITESFRSRLGIIDDDLGGRTWPDKFLPNLIACFRCLSVWVAVISLFCYVLLPIWVLYPLALSEITIWVEQTLERLFP